ncbi:MAG: tryptophan synthase alpha chain [Parcubacteria group bacterium Gr01-1014_8]|nr:MAG: tryptophan synthase alpha chain [Parcubacteria group bacterium Gr01-1014_8]
MTRMTTSIEKNHQGVALMVLLENRGKKSLFMAHMIAGLPTISESIQVAKALAKGGADIIEVQIPFSDPMADGPTIAVACEEALKKGATVKKALEVVKKVAKFKKPVVVMTYANPIYRMGIPKFIKTISNAGAVGLIVPDCPFDTMEGWSLLATCKAAGIALIPVVSPGVPKERLETLAKDATGFWYCTTRQGITGATSVFASDLPAFIKTLRSTSELPVAVGFGVKSKKDVKDLSKVADIVIAGSVFVVALKKNKKISAVEKTMSQLKL